MDPPGSPPSGLRRRGSKRFVSSFRLVSQASAGGLSVQDKVEHGEKLAQEVLADWEQRKSVVGTQQAGFDGVRKSLVSESCGSVSQLSTSSDGPRGDRRGSAADGRPGAKNRAPSGRDLAQRSPSMLLATDTLRELGRKELQQLKEKGRKSLQTSTLTMPVTDMGDTCNSKLVVRPESGFRVGWDLASLLCLGYISMVTPVRIGFEHDSSPGTFAYGFEFLIDLFFIIDVLVNFRTGYMRSDGGIEMRPRKIAKHYLKGYFLVDVVSSFPIDWVVQSLGNLQSAKVLKAGKILKVSRILKLAKLARLMKLPHLMERFEDEMRVSPVRLKLLRMLVTTSLIAHMNACGWALVSRLDEDAYYTNSWVQTYGFIDASIGSQYIAAVYWAITTMTTVGYGDIVPRSNGERLYCVMSMIFGGAYYAYVIATLSSIVTNQDANQRLISERMDSIMTYMRIRKFPKQLYRRVRKYFKHYYLTKTALNESTILQELSPGLRSEVALFLIDQSVSSNPLFKDMGAKSFAKLITILYPLKIEEGEYIFCAGDIGEEMFLLISGTLEVVDEEDVVQAVLGSGAYFGELCALGVANRRTCSVRAVEACELYTLSKADFFEAFAEQESETIRHMINLAVQTYDDLQIGKDASDAKSNDGNAASGSTVGATMGDRTMSHSSELEQAFEGDRVPGAPSAKQDERWSSADRQPTMRGARLGRDTGARGSAGVAARFRRDVRAEAAEESSLQTLFERVERMEELSQHEFCYIRETLARLDQMLCNDPRTGALVRAGASKKRLLHHGTRGGGGGGGGGGMPSRQRLVVSPQNTESGIQDHLARSPTMRQLVKRKQRNNSAWLLSNPGIAEEAVLSQRSSSTGSTFKSKTGALVTSTRELRPLPHSPSQSFLTASLSRMGRSFRVQPVRATAAAPTERDIGTHLGSLERIAGGIEEEEGSGLARA